MGDNDRPPSLDKLGDRLRAAREHRRAGEHRDDSRIGGPAGMSGLGMAFRIGVEMVSALVVGVGIGLLLDWWLDTRPWLFVVFFLLGAGAGIVNVYRATAGYGLAVGYRKERPDGDNGGDADDSGAGERPEGKNGES